MSAAVLVAGILGGAVLGTVPPMQYRGLDETLPEAGALAVEHRPQPDLPDHYPLITRAGTFEVHELGERGLYSQARYDWRDLDAYYPAEEFAFADEAAYEAGFADEAGPAMADATAAAADPPPAEPAPEPADPAHAPAGPQVAEASPRVVDVAAALVALDRPGGG